MSFILKLSLGILPFHLDVHFVSATEAPVLIQTDTK